jgi:tetratricopeptide (TPR) repeat protein
MGQILQQMEEWPSAEKVYGQVLSEDPDFPEAHTKASFVLYHLGDMDNALSEAKEALSINSNNAEAHKNAGLALESMRKFDAAVPSMPKRRGSSLTTRLHTTTGATHFAKSAITMAPSPSTRRQWRSNPTSPALTSISE